MQLRSDLCDRDLIDWKSVKQHPQNMKRLTKLWRKTLISMLFQVGVIAIGFNGLYEETDNIDFFVFRE